MRSEELGATRRVRPPGRTAVAVGTSSDPTQKVRNRRLVREAEPYKSALHTLPRPALAFPLGGRCHGKAVTDEGRGQAGVSATPEQEGHTLISHQCAHW